MSRHSDYFLLSSNNQKHVSFRSTWSNPAYEWKHSIIPRFSLPKKSIWKIWSDQSWHWCHRSCLNHENNQVFYCFMKQRGFIFDSSRLSILTELFSLKFCSSQSKSLTESVKVSCLLWRKLKSVMQLGQSWRTRFPERTEMFFVPKHLRITLFS